MALCAEKHQNISRITNFVQQIEFNIFQNFPDLFMNNTNYLSVSFNFFLAETNRSTFYFAEGESEQVSGFNVGYSGYLLFLFISAYTNILFIGIVVYIGQGLLKVTILIKMGFYLFFSTLFFFQKRFQSGLGNKKTVCLKKLEWSLLLYFKLRYVCPVAQTLGDKRQLYTTLEIKDIFHKNHYLMVESHSVFSLQIFSAIV